jgi:hypothetical protein
LAGTIRRRQYCSSLSQEGYAIKPQRHRDTEKRKMEKRIARFFLTILPFSVPLCLCGSFVAYTADASSRSRL